MRGVFDPPTRQAYSDKTGALFTRASVTYYLRGLPQPQSACLQHVSTMPPEACLTQTYAPQVRCTILYLDCGRWGGDGGPITNWPRCRDFGVVFGRAAAVCGYGPRGGTTEDHAAHESASPDQIAKSRDCQRILAFVAQLTTPRMGPAQIRQILDCPVRSDDQAALQGEPRRDRIYVFLGDLHLPVADEGNNGELLEEPTTRGRIVMGGNDDLNSPMTLSERIDWYNHYHGTGADIGADVFQHSRADLEEWLTVLRTYQVSPLGAGLPIHFIQTGDMFDFWIGLRRYFAADPAGDVVLEPSASPFVNYWLNETVDHTHEGRVARTLQQASRDLNGTFLYGNHDNYLKKLPTQPHSSGVSPRPAQFSDRDAGRRVGSVCAEHGHRTDKRNRDGCVDGHLGTQTAFFWPPVRNTEDVIRKGDELFSGAPPERITYLGEAADLCLANGCAVFVMGHTHHALVKRIDVVGPLR
jgi:hypothetical protein